MKHIFVLNQSAGGKLSKEELETKLNELNIDYEVIPTEYSGHAGKIVIDTIEKYNGTNETLRFYACGGDGTINEVSSKLVGKENVEFAVIPCGSGNDFVKYYGGMEKFADLSKVVNGTVKPIDIMKVGDDHYSINICNFGFEAIVGKTANEVKAKGGKDPYGKGIKKAIFTGMKHKITVEVDGVVINPKGKMMLCTLGNGNYVGGKFKCAPRSVIDDGLMEVCLIEPVSIFTFVALLGAYEQGTHLELNKKFIHYTRGKHVKIYSPVKDIDLCLDGEIITGNNFEVDILHNAINFVVPEGV